MTSIGKALLFGAAVSILFTAGVRAQTVAAASCNATDVQAALNSVTQASATVSIPAGTCTWTSGISFTIPSNTTSLVIQGAGAVSATTGGTSTTGTDNTVIYDNINYSSGPSQAIQITTAFGQSFRMTGLAIEENSSSTPPPAAMVEISGPSTAVRIDHCHFYMTLSAYDLFYSGPYGVIDHVFFDSTGANGGVRFEAPGTDTNGHAPWNQPDQWGTANFVYVEDSQFNRHGLGDCHMGGRFVIRHDTIQSPGNEAAPYMADHGLDTGGRSCRASEWYDNTFTFPDNPGNGQDTYSNNGGPALYWGNTVTGYRWAVQIGYTRLNNSTYNYASTPNGWGNCSSSTGDGWDQNLNSPSGYACMDQPARGHGDLLEGYLPPKVCNQTQGCPSYGGTWPRQALSPIYVWDNAVTPSTGYSSSGLLQDTTNGLLADNRDYYRQFGTYGESGTFSGTAGIGQGSVPPTSSGAYTGAPNCTPGNSVLTTIYNTAGQAPGVGYWDTSNNTLYVCTASNTWTAYYTPYTYPHPLTQSTSAVNPPTNLNATAH